MKICYLHGGKQVPTVRFRTPFFNQLRQRGHRCDLLASHPSRYESYKIIGWRLSRKLQQLTRHWQGWRVRLGQYDTVVIETGLFHTDDVSHERRIRQIARRLVYEIDDAVFLLFPDKIREIAAISDHVIAANEQLAEWIRPINSSVSVIPTCIDANEYQSKRFEIPSATSKPVIGWIGSSGNVSMLSVCAEALRRVSQLRQFELRIVSSDEQRVRELKLDGVQVRWVDIDRCDTIAQLQEFDIGIMPLPEDNPWMTYKCNAKMIQYMAVGVPAVGSAIGFNCELVEHGVDSMLASTTEQWTECLLSLLDSPTLRQSIGKAANQRIASQFTVQSRIDEYEQAILYR